MKLTLAVVAAAASALFGSALAADADPNAAQTLASMPECAQDCVRSSLSDIGCAEDDFTCGCDSVGRLTGEVTTCLVGKIVEPNCDVSAIAGQAMQSSFCQNATTDEVNSVSSVISNLIPSATSGPGQDDGDNAGSDSNATDKPGAASGVVGGSAFAGVVAVLAALAL